MNRRSASRLKLRKLGYYVRSSLALASRLRRRRDYVSVVVNPSKSLHFKNGLVLHVEDRLDILVAKETLCDDPYGLDELVEPRFIMDVGAGVGVFAIEAARRFRGCRVLAFEPDPTRCELLRANASANGFHVEAVAVAIGTRPHYVLARAGARTTSSPAGPSDHGLLIPGRRLAEVIAGETLDLLKIDCEGSELDVLESAGPHGLENVARIALEYHNFDGRRHDARLAEVLSDAGYVVRTVPDPYDRELGYLNARRV